MNQLNIGILVAALLCFGCSKKMDPSGADSEPDRSEVSQGQARSTDTKEEEMGNSSHVSNSIITGQIVEILPIDGASSPCDSNPCKALVRVLAVNQYGSNYHGQINGGDEVTVSFGFTLSPSEELFPELNEPLPGLLQNDVFEAELFESPDQPQAFRVKLYKKIIQ